jgi:glycine betaine catabolism B
MKVNRFTKSVFWLNCLLPVTLLGWDTWNGQIGANPVNFAIRTTGMLSLIFLVLSLTVTPVSRISGWGWLGQFRRILGLCAFFHAALHFSLFFAFDRAGSVRSTISEIVLRPYLAVGLFGLVLMAPLAATSTNSMIKRLGSARWKALHRLAYLAAAAGAVHYYMLVKADVSKPIAFLATLSVLFLFRLVMSLWRLRTDARKYRSAPPVAASTHAKPWTGQLRVAQIFEETPEVRTFRLVPASGDRLPFDFLPGQYLNLARVIDEQKVRRSYTIASAPTQTAYCEITVKREARGLFSKHLHDAVRAGDLLDVTAPAGRFTFTGAESASLALIAGGVGITPLMSKIRYLTDRCWPGEIHLVFSAKTEQDIIFRQELNALERRHPNLKVTITLSREDGGNWKGERGRITSEFLSRVVPGLTGKRVDICGPTEMTAPVCEMLRNLGVAEESIHIESFMSPSRAATGSQESTEALPAAAGRSAATAHGNGRASVTFARSAKSTPVPEDRTVLEAAELLGVTMNYDCRAGICGQCKTRLLDGRVHMEAEDALDASDRANNIILSCQAHCLGKVVVEA